MASENELKGVLNFFSETGTEGGYWAFQDEQHISLIPLEYGMWDESKVYDKKNPTRFGTVQTGAQLFHNGEWVPVHDPMSSEEDYFKSSLCCGESRGDLEADKRLMAKYDFTMEYAADSMDKRFGAGNWKLEDDGHIAIGPDNTKYFHGGTPHTHPQRPYGCGQGAIVRGTIKWQDEIMEERTSDSLLQERWSYEGLHTLENGDKLTIYDKDSETILWQGTIDLEQYDLFTESAEGMWIHSDQKGIARETWSHWFMEEYPANLDKSGKRNS
jgi:hypothetical protein